MNSDLTQALRKQVSSQTKKINKLTTEKLELENTVKELLGTISAYEEVIEVAEETIVKLSDMVSEVKGNLKTVKNLYSLK